MNREIKSEKKGSIVSKVHQDGGSGRNVNMEVCGVTVEPGQKIVAKSSGQIVLGQKQNYGMAPSARMVMTRRVQPLLSLNPYQATWTIKVRVTGKGNMRTFRKARREGCFFNVELTDEDGTQIQATTFDVAARKFYDKLVMGKVYFISKGTLKVANKQFNTVENDYEITLNENSEIEEANSEDVFVPGTKFNFVPVDMLDTYVNGKKLVDVIGVVQSVSPTVSVRRKNNDESFPKREIVIADHTKKTVTVSLWNDLATNQGKELLDNADKSPVVAIKSLKVGDFQGVSLSSIGKSTVVIDPDLPEAKKLRSWFASEGKGTLMPSVGSSLARDVYSDRVFLYYLASDQSIGEDKPAFFSTRAFVSFIMPDQTMWYRACVTCNKKVKEVMKSRYWCERCQKNDEAYNLRFMMVMKIMDASGEVYVSIFKEAECIIGCPAHELDRLKSEVSEENHYLQKLKQATWVPHLFRVRVTQHEYNGEKSTFSDHGDLIPSFKKRPRLLVKSVKSPTMPAHLDGSSNGGAAQDGKAGLLSTRSSAIPTVDRDAGLGFLSKAEKLMVLMNPPVPSLH